MLNEHCNGRGLWSRYPDVYVGCAYGLVDEVPRDKGGMPFLKGESGLQVPRRLGFGTMRGFVSPNLISEGGSDEMLW